MFEVGQKVWDVVAGEGVVSLINKEYHYPVIVRFSDGSERTYSTDGKSVKSNEPPSLYPYPVEIVKKMTKPTVNWNHVNSRYNYLAQDSDGTCWVYENEPIIVNDDWASSRGDCTPADCLQSLVPGTCF